MSNYNQEWFKTKEEAISYLESRGWQVVQMGMGVTRFFHAQLDRNAYLTRWGRKWHLTR